MEAEVGCFSDQETLLTDSAAINAWARDTDTQLQSSMRVLRDSGCEAVPVFAAICGTPGGRLSKPCHAELKTAFLSGTAEHHVCRCEILHLHGSVCAEGLDDVEGEWISVVRNELKFIGPIVISLDLHANVTPRMLEHVNAVTACRTAPHIDFVETGERAARLLLNLPSVTTRSIATVPGLFSPTATHHERGPFAELLNKARMLEELPEILDISLFPVQPWLDVEDLESRVVVTATDGEVGGRLAAELAEDWLKGRNDWPTGLKDWQEIHARLATPTSGPWLLVDTADATTGGSDGSSAEAIKRLWLLRANLVGTVWLWVVKPEAISATARVGDSVRVDLVGIQVEGAVTFAGECRFQVRGAAYTGQEVSCGRAVVLAAEQLRIVITEEGCLCLDPAFYETVGLLPDEALAVQVKSLLGWQPGYDAAPERGLYFDGPGFTSLNFARLSFSGTRRELFPINSTTVLPISLWQST